MITSCTKCGCAYEAGSEEQANEPTRFCPNCRSSRKFRIESRWPKWSKWKTLTPAPHSERHTFDSKGLFWGSFEAANAARLAYEAVNEGEFRIVEDLRQ